MRTRAVLALEVASNRGALEGFCRTLDALDKERKPPGTEEHLASMAFGGLLSYTLPNWSVVRWERLPPQAYAALTAGELAALDAIYRDLRGIADLYARLVTLTPQEMEELGKDRFWYNRYAGWRSGIYARLAQVVARVLAAGDPLRA